MNWLEQLHKQIDPTQHQIINDSKTPSGRTHVGSLRGVLIHDATFRYLKQQGVSVEYRFGVDDFDPLDEIPAGHDDFYTEHLGKPLCNVPSHDAGHTDVAKLYISEFFDIFKHLGVDAKHYYMRDIYRAGEFNQQIDQILQNADKVRSIFLKVSNSEKGEDWFPFNPICEKCGKIGTTVTTAYDGKEVEYHCRVDGVSWAQGCGYKGKVSPFDGNGKLPWKLEWVAKWNSFPVTIEGAGKDHSSKGGSRDVAAACLRAIFQKQPPANMPYEFFLVDGQKMSSSKGIGSSAHDISQVLEPEILRFLMIKSRPNRPINFSPDYQSISRIYSDYDKLHGKDIAGEISEDDKVFFDLSQVDQSRSETLGFSTLVNALQLPHIDVGEFAKLQLDSVDEGRLAERVSKVENWLKLCASEDDKLVIHLDNPGRDLIDESEQKFLKLLGGCVADLEWKSDVLQQAVFDTARLAEIKPKEAFAAVYKFFLRKTSGPKAGELLGYLPKEQVLNVLTLED